MTFSIDAFKSAMDRYGGPARNNIFSVQFSSLQTGSAWETSEFNSRDLMFFCKAVTLPGISLSVFDYRPTNIEMPQSVPFAMNHEQLECVFIVEDQHKVYSYFHNWMQQIINYNTDGLSGGAVQSPSNDTNYYQMPYELGYKKDYVQTMTIRKYSKSPTLNNDNYTCSIYGVYPTSIGSTTLSWDENDTYTVLPVSFSYTSFIMSGVTPNLELENTE